MSSNPLVSRDQVALFMNNGYVLGGQLLNDDQVEVLRAEMDRVIRDKDNADVRQPHRLLNIGEDENPVWQIVNIWQASSPFEQLVKYPAVADAISRLIPAKEIRLWHDQIQYKPAQKGGVNMWHQDAPYWWIIEPATQVTAWIALDDVDEDNGCMSMVPGSHSWGDHLDYLESLPDFTAMPRSYQGHDIQVVTCPVKKGQVHFHHSLTWHGSQANISGRPRRAIALHYMTEETCYVAGDDHPVKGLIEVADGEMLQGKMFPLVYPYHGGIVAYSLIAFRDEGESFDRYLAAKSMPS